MKGMIALAAFAALIGLVLIRTRQLKKLGIKAMRFGETDKTDFLLPPFVLLYFYLIAAHTFGWPRFGAMGLDSGAFGWLGALLFALAVMLFGWGMVSFGNSFRVGIDGDKAGGLVTTGAFAISRNPLYVAFLMMLIGVVLVFPNWVFLGYLLAGAWVLRRQIGREEASLRQTYGDEYDAYAKRVRRYL